MTSMTGRAASVQTDWDAEDGSQTGPPARNAGFCLESACAAYWSRSSKCRFVVNASRVQTTPDNR
jgi:7-cyano-7-deazaguanine synthase in queuosine biosynthesis